MTMPEKIYCACGDGFDEDGALCVNCVHVLSIEIEALKAENKMLEKRANELADALEFLLFGLEDFEKYNECALPNNAIHMAKEALAQRIGGKQ